MSASSRTICPFPRAPRLRRRAGLAYVAVLVLTMLMTGLGLSFLLKAGTQANATMRRSNDIQAKYLAEAAVNHALWRLLNDPTLSVASNVYTMHPIAGGRYGYKIRRNTATTFATVATVGIMGDSTVRQSYVIYIKSGSPGYALPQTTSLVYDTNANSLDKTPWNRIFQDPGWSVAGPTLALDTSTVPWAELRGSPTRQGMQMGTLDYLNQVNLVAWNGLDWGNRLTLSTDADRASRCFDLAYESFSGNALAIGRNGAGSTPNYATWNGSAWSAIANAPATGGGTITIVKAAALPNSNNILVAYLDASSDVYLWLWDGFAFNNLGLIETNASASNLPVLDIAFESRTGRALIAWGRNSVQSFMYRIWNGAVLSAESQGPNFGQKVNLVRLAADPASNQILLGAVDASGALRIALWDGSAWTDSCQAEPSVQSASMMCYDLAWEAQGSHAVAAWGRSGQTALRYFRWTRGTPLATGQLLVGPDFSDRFQTLRMLPVRGGQEILLVANSGVAGSDLRYSLWSGSSFTTVPPTLLASNLSSPGSMPYALADNAPGRSDWGHAYLAYDTALDAKPKIAKYCGGTFGAAATTYNIGNSQAKWMDLVTCPLRNEMVMGTVGNDNHVNMAIWTPDGWGQNLGMTTSAEADVHCFGVAYERASGRALALSRNSNNGQILYSLWNGTSWSPSPASLAFSTGGGQVKQVVARSHPSGNEILIAVVDDSMDIYLYRWTGSAFVSHGKLEVDCTRVDTQVVDIAYESLSGRALVAWGKNGVTTCRYRIWNGSVLLTEGLLPDFGKKARYLRLVSDPVSNQVFAAALGDDNHLNVALWNGSAWSDSREVGTAVHYNDRPDFDVAWQRKGDRVLLCWSNAATSALAYFSWQKGTALASGTVSFAGPDSGNFVSTIRLFPLLGSGEVLVAFCDSTQAMNYTLWNGTAFSISPPTQMDTSLSDDRTVPYALTGR